MDLSDSSASKGILDMNMENHVGQIRNPLEIPEIASVVFEHLPFSDLINSRLVCKTWGEEITKLAANRSKIYIKTLEDLKMFVHWESISSIGTSTSPNLSIIRSLSKFHLKFNDRLCNDYKQKQSQSVGFGSYDMFKIIGHKIDTLEMYPEPIGKFPQRLFPLSKYLNELPNLHSLVIYKIYYDFAILNDFLESDSSFPSIKELKLEFGDDPGHIFLHLQLGMENRLKPCFHKAVISFMKSNIPNLETLTLTNKDANYTLVGEEFMTQPLSESGSDEFKNLNPQLKNLNFILNLNEEEVIKLQKFNYPLETLRMSIRPGLRFPALYTFLGSLGPTLTFLELDFVLVPASQETFPCGPDLINLRHLSLKNYYGPLDFLHCMEKLRTLSLTNVNLSVAFGDDGEHSLKRLHSLEIFSSQSNAGRISFMHIFRKISKLFPELRRLRMDYLSDSNLQSICEGCPHLEELLLANSICTDQSITGLSNDVLEKVRSVTADSFELGEIPRQPSIATLKNLKILHINAPRLSDASLLFGLSLCKELKELCLSTPSITSSALKYTVMKLHLKSLRLNHCYQIIPLEVDGLSYNSLTENVFDRSSKDFDSFPWPDCKTGECKTCGVSM